MSIDMSPRRAAAGDREQDAGLAQALHGLDRPVGEDLVLGHQGAVDIGQQQPDHECSA
jgi:hypothetical protein